jgi:hypothetical protein
LRRHLASPGSRARRYRNDIKEWVHRDGRGRILQLGREKTLRQFNDRLRKKRDTVGRPGCRSKMHHTFGSLPPQFAVLISRNSLEKWANYADTPRERCPRI